MKHNNHAFTLIELLVVVLIIGILAAVALPQYQLTVAKSKVATMLSLGASFRAAQEAYYLTNGTYTTNAESLDIGMAGNCQIAGQNSNILDEEHTGISIGSAAMIS